MHHQLNYVELPCRQLAASVQFFQRVFAWQFVDYGPEYSSFTKASAGIDGGFYQAPLVVDSQTGAPLLVLFANDLDACQTQVLASGGEICKAIFSFPGGRRFHFRCPSGNEFAVWGHDDQQAGAL